MSEPGTLYIIGMPIGNPEDITLRALATLDALDLLLCEDTRKTRVLLKIWHKHIRMESFHSHNLNRKIPFVIERLLAGEKIGLVADHGMPAISDTGTLLIDQCRGCRIPVIPIPGPSSLCTALSVAGFPPAPVVFVGFLSRKRGRRRKELQRYGALDGNLTFLIYESKHRIKELLNDIRDLWGDIDVLIAREMTKVHEEYIRGKTAEIIERFSKNEPKGEFTLVFFRGNPVNDR